MGTRADFYVGKNVDEMQYLGSIAWDGYPDNDKVKFLSAKNEVEYVKAVQQFLNERQDGSIPERDGWPWPWDDSQLTDYSYTFADGRAWVSCFGTNWKKWTRRYVDRDEENAPKIIFPNMKKFQKVTLGKRSGVLIIKRS
jgi:hypothetical protein